MKNGKFFTILLFFSFQVEALIPLESLMLGDLSSQYRLEKDPINYIYEEKVKGSSDKLRNYLAFNDEAYNLHNFCDDQTKISYIDRWSKSQVQRSILATLQYIGLDTTTRAIAEYSKFFEFTEDEFNNLTNHLVGNYCSQNVSVISLKQLKRNFSNYYNIKDSISLPSVEDDPRFPKGLWQTTKETISKTQEFSVTMDLFKTFCSWGGDIDNLRLMVPLVRDPAIMSFIIRNMLGEKFAFQKEKTTLVRSKESTTVICDNLVCRKRNVDDIRSNLRLSLGGQSYKDDFKRLYCTTMKNVDYQYKAQVPKLLEIIKEMTFDEQNLLASQFVALLTAVPDFLVRSERYDNMKDGLKASMDQSWRDWASDQIVNFRHDLLYEERLILKIVDRNMFFNEYIPKFEVNIDVTMGEFDNSVAMNDKIESSFDIQVSKKFLTWARRIWKEVDSNNVEETKKVLEPFELILKDQISDAKRGYDIAPWKEGMERLVAIEILEQVSRYIGKYFDEPTGMVKIPVNLHYGIFALRYSHQRWKIAQDSGKREERIKKLQQLLPAR